jgi:hypothetical protein
VLVAYMRGVRGTHGVRFPDVHFVAACTIFTAAGVSVVRGRLPAVDVGLWNGVLTASPKRK